MPRGLARMGSLFDFVFIDGDPIGVEKDREEERRITPRLGRAIVGIQLPAAFVDCDAELECFLERHDNIEGLRRRLDGIRADS